MAGGEGVVRVFKMFCQRGQIFFYLPCVYVCVWGVRLRTSSSVKKITDPPPITVPVIKSPKGNSVAYLFIRYFFFLRFCRYFDTSVLEIFVE